MTKYEKIEVTDLAKRMDALAYKLQNLAAVLAIVGIIILVAVFR